MSRVMPLVKFYDSSMGKVMHRNVNVTETPEDGITVSVCVRGASKDWEWQEITQKDWRDMGYDWEICDDPTYHLHSKWMEVALA